MIKNEDLGHPTLMSEVFIFDKADLYFLRDVDNGGSLGV